jgi:hypothetical protein
MADDTEPVQHQPNVADDPKGQKSGVRGVPIERTGKPMDDATGLPKSEKDQAKVDEQLRELKGE